MTDTPKPSLAQRLETAATDLEWSNPPSENLVELLRAAAQAINELGDVVEAALRYSESMIDAGDGALDRRAAAEATLFASTVQFARDDYRKNSRTERPELIIPLKHKQVLPRG